MIGKLNIDGTYDYWQKRSASFHYKEQVEKGILEGNVAVFTTKTGIKNAYNRAKGSSDKRGRNYGDIKILEKDKN